MAGHELRLQSRTYEFYEKLAANYLAFNQFGSIRLVKESTAYIPLNQLKPRSSQ